jgi:hypothetical protein
LLQQKAKHLNRHAQHFCGCNRKCLRIELRQSGSHHAQNERGTVGRRRPLRRRHSRCSSVAPFLCLRCSCCSEVDAGTLLNNRTHQRSFPKLTLANFSSAISPHRSLVLFFLLVCLRAHHLPSLFLPQTPINNISNTFTANFPAIVMENNQSSFRVRCTNVTFSRAISRGGGLCFLVPHATPT